MKLQVTGQSGYLQVKSKYSEAILERRDCFAFNRNKTFHIRERGRSNENVNC